MSVYVAVCKASEVDGFPVTGCVWSFTIPDIVHEDEEAAVEFYKSKGLTDEEIAVFSFIDAEEFSNLCNRCKWFKGGTEEQNG